MQQVVIDYTNWKGNRRERCILPIGLVWHSNEWHTEPQWMIVAQDVEDFWTIKHFPLANIHSWRPA